MGFQAVGWLIPGNENLTRSQRDDNLDDPRIIFVHFCLALVAVTSYEDFYYPSKLIKDNEMDNGLVNSLGKF